MRPVNGLVTELQGLVANLQSVGDATSVRTVLEALEEGYEAGLRVSGRDVCSPGRRRRDRSEIRPGGGVRYEPRSRSVD